MLSRDLGWLSHCRLHRAGPAWPAPPLLSEMTAQVLAVPPSLPPPSGRPRPAPGEQPRSTGAGWGAWVSPKGAAAGLRAPGWCSQAIYPRARGAAEPGRKGGWPVSPAAPRPGGQGKSRCLLPGSCAGGRAELCVSRNGDAGTGAWVKGGMLHTEAASQGPRRPSTRPDGETEAPSPSWAGPMLVSTPRPTGIGKDQGQAQEWSSACPSSGLCWESVCAWVWWGDHHCLRGEGLGWPLPTAAQCGLRGALGKHHPGCSGGQSGTALSASPTHSAQRSPEMLGLSGTICRRAAKHALLHSPSVFSGWPPI